MRRLCYLSLTFTLRSDTNLSFVWARFASSTCMEQSTRHWWRFCLVTMYETTAEMSASPEFPPYSALRS